MRTSIKQHFRDTLKSVLEKSGHGPAPPKQKTGPKPARTNLERQARISGYNLYVSRNTVCRTSAEVKDGTSGRDMAAKWKAEEDSVREKYNAEAAAVRLRAKSLLESEKKAKVAEEERQGKVATAARRSETFWN